MELGFLIIFLVGIVLAVVTWAFGEIFELGGDLAEGIGEAVGDIAGVDADVDTGVDLASGADINVPSPFSSRVIFSGITAFGGFGYIGSVLDWPVVLSVLFALAGFFGVSAGMFFGVVVPIARQQGTIRELRSDYIGLEANVTSEIPADGLGQVTLESPASGTIVTEAATSSTGEKIPQGTSVKVVRVAAGSIVVAPVE